MRVLMLDCNYICHAVFHAMPALQTHQQYTQVIFGFIKKVISFSQEFKPNEIVFTWDSKFSVRKEVYPSYKQQRADKQKEATSVEKHAKKSAYLQFDDIRDSILPSLGFAHVFMQDGYEGDDVMASVVDNNPTCDFVVATTDKDMYQIISDTCMLYNPVTKALRTVDTFKKEWGCHPSLWAEARSISGCSTDNISGVKGVAEKTAIRYLLGEMDPKSKKFKDIEDALDTIILNRELIMLPMYGTKKFKIDGNNLLSRQKFIKFCEEYSFKSLLGKKTLDKWDEIVV